MYKPSRFSTDSCSSSQAFFPLGLIHPYAERSVQPSPQKDCRAAAKRPGDSAMLVVSENGGYPGYPNSWMLYFIENPNPKWTATGNYHRPFWETSIFLEDGFQQKEVNTCPNHHTLKGYDMWLLYVSGGSNMGWFIHVYTLEPWPHQRFDVRVINVREPTPAMFHRTPESNPCVISGSPPAS